MSNHNDDDDPYNDDADESGIGDSSMSGTNTGTSGRSGGGGGANQSTTQTSTDIAAAETRAIMFSKLIVLLILAGTTVLAGYGTYVFVKREEQNDFQNDVRTLCVCVCVKSCCDRDKRSYASLFGFVNPPRSFSHKIETLLFFLLNVMTKQFQKYAVDLSSLIHQLSKNTYLSVGNFAGTITSYVLEDKESTSWPFVTVPDYEARGITSNELSKSALLGFCPLVTSVEQKEWETYAVANQGWIEQGLTYSYELHGQSNDNEDMQVMPTSLINPHIFKMDPNSGEQITIDADTTSSSSQFLPLWQMAPAPQDPSMVNYDLLSNAVFGPLFDGIKELQRPVLSPIADLNYLYNSSYTVEGGSNTNYNKNHFAMMYPIFNNFMIQNQQSQQQQQPDQPVVAVAIAILSWEKILNSLMPEAAFGLVVVIQNTCGNTFTYLINGHDAIFIGDGDLHDALYDDLRITTSFVTDQVVALSSLRGGNSTVATTMDSATKNSHCEYTLNIYPSSELHSIYMTGNPTLYMVVVVMVFVLTTGMFVMYDIHVKRRQDKVLAQAKKSNAVVASLFPKNVRERILKEAEEQVEQEMADRKQKKRTAAKNQLRDFLSDEEDNKSVASGASGKSNSSGIQGKPIADLFPSATIFFCDIAGFTAWSSVREPTQGKWLAGESLEFVL